MADPERFTVDGVVFVALPTTTHLPHFWRPEIEGIAFSVYRLDTGARRYVAGHVHFGSLEAAGRGAILRKAVEISTWRNVIEKYDQAKLKLADILATSTQK